MVRSRQLMFGVAVGIIASLCCTTCTSEITVTGNGKTDASSKINPQCLKTQSCSLGPMLSVESKSFSEKFDLTVTQDYLAASGFRDFRYQIDGSIASCSTGQSLGTQPATISVPASTTSLSVIFCDTDGMGGEVTSAVYTFIANSGTKLTKLELGETNNNVKGQVFVDSNSHIFYIGSYEGTLNLGSDGSQDVSVTSNGSSDLFFVKYDEFGKILLSASFGGSGEETLIRSSYKEGAGFALNGYYEGTVPFGSTNLAVADGNKDLYVLKLSENFVPVFAHSYAVPATSSPLSLSAIHIKSNGAVVASFQLASGSYDFDPSAGTDTKTSIGWGDAYLTQFESSGSYARTIQVSTSQWDGEMGAVSSNSSNDTYWTTTIKSGGDVNPGAGTVTLTSHGQTDPFYALYSDAGTYIESGLLGGSGYDYVNAIGADSSNNVTLAGLFTSTNFDKDPKAGSSVLTKPTGVTSDWDLWAAKYSSAGSPIWAFAWGGSGNQYIWSGINGPNSEMMVIGTYEVGFNVNFDATNSVTVPDLAPATSGWFATLITAAGLHSMTLTFVSPTSTSAAITNVSVTNEFVWVAVTSPTADAVLSHLGSSTTHTVPKGNSLIRIARSL